MLDKDFTLGFYLLNLFLLYDDIKTNVYPDLNLNIKEEYITKIEKTLKHLDLKNIHNTISIFNDWILNNIELVISEKFENELKKLRINYNDILKILIRKLSTYNEAQIKTLILLINRAPNFYLDCFEIKFKCKNVLIENFKSFIRGIMIQKSNLVSYLSLVDYYIDLIKKDNVLKQEISLFCKKQIDQLDDIFSKISLAELFINIVNKYNLKFKCTNDLPLWYENLNKELLNSDKMSWTKFLYNPFNDQEEYDKKINEVKTGIKSNNLKTLFYDPKAKTSFHYKSDFEGPLMKIFRNNNRMGTYYQESTENITFMQNIKLQFFSSLFFDKEIFNIYISNFADILECILYNLGIIEEERIFFITRYYEIIEQLNNEKQNINNKSPFVYMKEMSLVFSAIEDFIKIFIGKNESFTIVSNIDQSFSRYLIEINNSDIKKEQFLLQVAILKTFYLMMQKLF